MTDWTQGRKQRFRYYEVNRSNWRDYREIDGVVSCEVTRDFDSTVRESAKLTVMGDLDPECIVRAYLETQQKTIRGQYGAWERHCIGTWICQTPERKWRRGVGELVVDAYSPLLALSDDKPPTYHTVRKGANACAEAITALKHGIAPVELAAGDRTTYENHTCDTDDSWMDLAISMAEMAGMSVFVNERGMPYLEADRDASALSPVWTYEDGANSILIGGIDDKCDWYSLPNVVEVVATGDVSTYVGTAMNQDGGSPTSTQSRGRRVLKRVTDADLSVISQDAVDRRAAKILAEESSVERRLTYEHGYCPVKLGQCVRVLSRKHGIDLKAKVVKQTIRLQTQLTVTEEAACKMPMGGAL